MLKTDIMLDYWYLHSKKDAIVEKYLVVSVENQFEFQN